MAQWGRGRSRGWISLVLVLSFCHAVAITCTQILNILVDPIKAGLSLSDTEYSLLQGLAVAVFAAVLGIPAGRFADRDNRRLVIAIGVAVWSVASAACGLTRTFQQLMVARAFVGIGEVLLFPSALSLIASVTPAGMLARGIALFGMGGPVGAAVALMGGGWLLVHRPRVVTMVPLLNRYSTWQIAFFACGVLGTLALMSLLLVKEPARAVASQEKRETVPALPRDMLGNPRAFGGTISAMLLLSLAVFATSAWVPTFLVRGQGFTFESAGRLTGMAALSCAAGGAWLAGLSIDAIDNRGRSDGVVIVTMAIAGLLGTLAWAMCLAHSQWVAEVCVCAVYGILAMPTVLCGTALQQISRTGSRAQIMAFYMVLLNLFSLGFGPSAVAILTDDVFKSPQSVGFSIAVVDSLAAGLAIICLVQTRRSFANRHRELMAKAALHCVS